jgi:hypothetical protein
MKSYKKLEVVLHGEQPLIFCKNQMENYYSESVVFNSFNSLPHVCNKGYLVLSLQLLFHSVSQTHNQQPLVSAITQTRGRQGSKSFSISNNSINPTISHSVESCIPPKILPEYEYYHLIRIYHFEC